jgi:anti-anti-sigma factor
MTELARVVAGTLDGAPVVRVSGEVDLSNAAAVRDSIAAAASEAASVVTVDLSDTTYLDSAGISMIFRLAERLTYSRQELRLVVPQDAPIRAVLRLTKLDQVIPVLDAGT